MSSAMRLMASPLTSLALILLAASPAAAVEPLDTFSARIGGYVSTFDTQLRADGQTSAGTSIDLKRDLDVDPDNTVALVGLTWRPFEHHEFGLTYYQNDASASKRLQREIAFDGTVYPVEATVRSEYDLDAYEANYVWWAASHERWALGPRLGLIWYRISLDIDLELSGNGNQASSPLSNEVSADLPAPTIGGSWRWTPAEQWRISADAGYFSANSNGIDADVLFGRAGVEWYPWERVGFWLDYTISDIDAQVDKSRLNGDFNFRNSGVRLGIAYRF